MASQVCSRGTMTTSDSDGTKNPNDGYDGYDLRLRDAYDKIAELQREVFTLLDEIEALRIIVDYEPPPRTPSPTKPTTPNNTKRFTQATVSSRRKDKSTPTKSDGNDDKASPAISSGVKRRGSIFTPEMGPTPRYMKVTRASHSRELESWAEHEERKKRLGNHLKQPGSAQKWDILGPTDSRLLDSTNEQPFNMTGSPGREHSPCDIWPPSPEANPSLADTEVESAEPETKDVPEGNCVSQKGTRDSMPRPNSHSLQDLLYEGLI